MALTLDEKLGIPTSYNPSNNREVATALGVKYEQFLSIVFFKDFNSRDVIVCPLPAYVFDKDKAKERDLKEVILGRFEGVFSAVEFEEQREARWDKLEKYVKRVRRSDKGIGWYESVKREGKSIGELVSPFLGFIPG
jgi:hypothetical protein